MPKQLKITPIILFLFPILFSLGLFTVLIPGCQTGDQETSGSIKLLYTSEVGGRLDPCG